MKVKLLAAMAAYILLAGIAWVILEDVFRYAVWVLLAGLAVKTWLSTLRD